LRRRGGENIPSEVIEELVEVSLILPTEGDGREAMRYSKDSFTDCASGRATNRKGIVTEAT